MIIKQKQSFLKALLLLVHILLSLKEDRTVFNMVYTVKKKATIYMWVKANKNVNAQCFCLPNYL